MYNLALDVVRGSVFSTKNQIGRHSPNARDTAIGAPSAYAKKGMINTPAKVRIFCSEISRSEIVLLSADNRRDSLAERAFTHFPDFPAGASSEEIGTTLVYTAPW